VIGCGPIGCGAADLADPDNGFGRVKGVGAANLVVANLMAGKLTAGEI
jgi:hypothetical protein